jgi:hypothetical protein
VELSGHLWTVVPHLAARVAAPPLAGFSPWSRFVADPQAGAVRLQGRLRAAPSDTAVVVVHGLGGGLDSPYMRRAGAALARAGVACLLLAVRGADRGGDDFYHAGQTDDLEAAIASEALAPYREVCVLGFSLGGHMALRLALRPPPRLRAVAAVCAPLDLARASRAIDSTSVYRRHILRGLKEMYAQVARRGEVPTPMSVVRRIDTIRSWDTMTVVPRYRFASVDDYYERMSVGPRLPELRVPALIVHSRADPMVPTWTVEPSLRATGPWASVRRLARGGHVGFPGDVDLGLPGPRGLEPQILSWFARLS